ncbi:C40 family peptidase [Pseudonocardia acidicola]|nr:NlpC/P60 family protein [Pseudonocardia acidicola]
MTADGAKHRAPAQRESGGEVRLATELIERFAGAPAAGGPHRHAAAAGASGASDDEPAAHAGEDTPSASRPSSVAPHQSVLAVVAASVVGATAAVTSAAGAPTAAAPHPAPSDTQYMRLAAATTSTVGDAPRPLPATAAVAETVVATVPELEHRVDAARIAAQALISEQEHAAAARKAQALAAAAHAPGGDAAGLSGLGVGAAALKAALTRLGMPYEWGAAGPSAFDCSGLVLWAFKQVGISLPHSAAAQSTMGTAVPPGQLQPGDLVFFYSPVSHVGIYLGDGKVLDATESGQPVMISKMADLPFHNARRL